ncbi:MAG: penicillin-binding protein [Chitinophagales bacterium]
MENTKKDIMWRLYLVFAALLVTGLLISAQIINVQFVHGAEYRAMADSMHVKQMKIVPKRGSIYSERGDILATSYPYFNIYMDPVAPDAADFKKNIDSLSICLSHLFGDMSAAQYKQKITQARNKGKRYLSIYKKATLPDKQELEKFPLFRMGKNKGGLITEPLERRAYPYNSLANRTIGYVSNNGAIGLEGAYDSILAGKPGLSVMRKVSGGNWIPVGDENQIEPEDGMDVITTLDINMQDITETALRHSLVKNNAAWGTAIVMEVKTGKIKAIANLSRRGEGNYVEDYNYAISTRVEPGSTWKMISLLSMFEDGLSIDDMVDLHNGSYQFANKTMYDSEGHHNHRDETVKTAFALSSNVGISRLAYNYYGSDPQKYIDRLEKLGVTHKTGIEIAGEPTPIIKNDPKKSNWYKTTIPWMSVGYELQVTPLQILTVYNGIANDGKMMKPYLVDRIEKYGATVEEHKPEVLNDKMCSKRTLEELKECMEAVVDSGTAKSLKNSYYDFAGKTGTAQLYDPALKAYGHNYLASFAGYFPAEEPKYTIIVVISSPSNGVYYGGYVSGPVFREIADKVYSHFINMREPVNEQDSLFVGVHASTTGYTDDLRNIFDFLHVDETFDDNTSWIHAEANGKTSTYSTLQTADNIMPDVRGMGLRDAIYLLEDTYGLKVDVQGVGKVVQQSILPGQQINNGNYVALRLH